uniref:HIT domain-containing protein n=1 Tax=Kalmanozyma brasiliensis (strain GHG001) TaxID=1365824 RepID=V5E536_KALBG
MPSLFNSCFGRKEDPQSELLSSTDGYSGSMPPAGKRKVDDVNPAKCIFCNVSRDRFNIVLEDDKYICFSDRSPAAAVHLLVIPRTHIANVQSLTSRDTQLVREMQASLKYRIAKPSSPDYYKGWSWFAEWKQTCALLDAGRKVKVSSC